MKTKVLDNIITEALNELLTENRAGKNLNLGRKFLIQQGLSLEQAQAELDEIRRKIPNVKLGDGKFIQGVARMWYNGELKDTRIANNLDTTLKHIITSNFNEYNENLNGLSAQELINSLKGNIEQELEADKQKNTEMQFNGNSQYDIVRIDSFEQAQQYSEYTEWCVTHKEIAFDSYTSNGVNQFYFCLRKGFEEVSPQPSEGCPLDEYGLSMIAVLVNENGGLSKCTCRWNHDNGGNDNVMDTKQISEVIGKNFYDVFKPNTTWKDTVENALQRVRNGEDPWEVFKYCDDFKGGLARVKLKRKWNYLTQEGTILSPKLWFDSIAEFNNDGFARVRVNEKYNFIDTEGNLLYKKPVEQWFDWCMHFHNGLAIIENNRKLNYLTREGTILSPNQWFDYCGDFYSRLSWIEFNKNKYCIDTEGNLYDYETKQPLNMNVKNMNNSQNTNNALLERIINESIRKVLNEQNNYVDTNKVLLVKKYLDNNFVRAKLSTIGDDGYPGTKSIVGMKGSDGSIIRNMDSRELFYLLQDKFNGLYNDKMKRDNLLKQIIKDWYSKKITKHGLLSRNSY